MQQIPLGSNQIHGFLNFQKKNLLQTMSIYGDVSMAVIVAFAFVGDGVPFEMLDELTDLFPTVLSGDLTVFGVKNRNNSATVIDT